MFIQKQISSFKFNNRNNYYKYRSRFLSIYNYSLNLTFYLILSPLAIFSFPLYFFLKTKNYKFINGFMTGTGHLIPEFDYFVTRYQKNKNIILINRKETEFKIIIANFEFKKIISNIIYFKIVNLFLNYYPDLLIDVSFTKHKNAFYPNLFSQKYKINYYFKYYNKYLKSRKINESFFKLNLNYLIKSNSLDNFIDFNKKTACIHIKEIIINAVAEKVDPSTYLDTIKFLIKKNYQIIFVGREKMPKIFKQFNILNYANSQYANLYNDFQIFNLSEISIICGSGISYIPDTLDKKYLYINSWHISRPGGIGKKSIIVPAMIKNKISKKFLTFHEQAIMENTGRNFFSQFLNKKKYSVRNISSDELLNATKELIYENFTTNEYQNIFKKNMENYGWFKNSNSIVSKYFVVKHKKLLN